MCETHICAEIKKFVLQKQNIYKRVIKDRADSEKMNWHPKAGDLNRPKLYALLLIFRLSFQSVYRLYAVS